MKKILNIIEILLLVLTTLLYYVFAFPEPTMSRIYRFPYANDTIRMIVDILIITVFIVRIGLIIRSFLKPWNKMKLPNTFERILFFLGIMFLSFEIIFYLNIYVISGGWLSMYFFYAIILSLLIIFWSIELKKRTFKVQFISIKLKQ